MTITEAITELESIEAETIETQTAIASAIIALSCTNEKYTAHCFGQIRWAVEQLPHVSTCGIFDSSRQCNCPRGYALNLLSAYI